MLEVFASFDSNTYVKSSEQIRKLQLVLYMLHGISRCGNERGYAYLSQYFTHFIKLVDMFENETTDIVLKIYEIFKDIAETDLEHMDKNDSNSFFKYCLQLITKFGDISLKRAAIINNDNINKSIKDDTEEIQIKEMSVILCLLEHMSSRDVYGWAGTLLSRQLFVLFCIFFILFCILCVCVKK